MSLNAESSSQIAHSSDPLLHLSCWFCVQVQVRTIYCKQCPPDRLLRAKSRFRIDTVFHLSGCNSHIKAKDTLEPPTYFRRQRIADTANENKKIASVRCCGRKTDREECRKQKAENTREGSRLDASSSSTSFLGPSKQSRKALTTKKIPGTIESLNIGLFFQCVCAYVVLSAMPSVCEVSSINRCPGLACAVCWFNMFC